MQEADAKQAIEHLPRELRGMPDLGNLETRNERERVGPVGACIESHRDTRIPPDDLLGRGLFGPG